VLEENPANKKKLLKAVKEFRSYIEANQAFIPNYGDRTDMARQFQLRSSNRL
jgi:hypothetical protein